MNRIEIRDETERDIFDTALRYERKHWSLVSVEAEGCAGGVG